MRSLERDWIHISLLEHSMPLIQIDQKADKNQGPTSQSTANDDRKVLFETMLHELKDEVVLEKADVLRRCWPFVLLPWVKR